MDDQPVRRDRRAVGEKSGRDHEPADRALKSAEREQDRQPGTQPPLDLAARPKHDERRQEREPNEAAPQPMDPFKPENLLEPIQPNGVVDQSELRDLLIEAEQALPFSLA